MPTDEFKPLLNRDGAQRDAQQLIDLLARFSEKS
jgi:hypothetical protein